MSISLPYDYAEDPSKVLTSDVDGKISLTSMQTERDTSIIEWEGQHHSIPLSFAHGRQSGSVSTTEGASTDNSEPDFTALSALYVSTGGNAGQWFNGKGWMNGLPCTNTWYGVHCSSGNNQVVELHLEGNGLIGRLPSQIGLLTHMTSYFKINSNNIMGTLPSQLGELEAIKSNLDIYSNSFSGQIPSQFGKLKAMAGGFILNSNDLEYGIPTQFGRLSHMTATFNVQSNRLTGVLPSQLGKLSSMTSNFIFSYNSVTGTLPSQLGNLKQMNFDFEFSSNSLSGTLPSQLGLPAMRQRFQLDSNRFSGSIPTQFGFSPMQFDFDLSFNRLTSSIPSQIGQMTDLTDHLNLSMNSLCGEIPTSLELLLDSMSDSDVTTGNFVGPTSCPTVSGLVALYEGTSGRNWRVKQNWMKRDPCDSSWYGFKCSSSGSALELNLDSNNISGSLPTEAGDLTTLINTFSLNFNSINGSLPTQLGQMVGLKRTFSLGFNFISGTLPSQVGRIVNTSHSFHMGANSLTSNIPTQLGQMTSLMKSFVLDTNSIDGSLPTELGRLANISQNFQLQLNKLTRNIPTEIGQMTEFRGNFSLQMNLLSGSLPSELGHLRLLSQEFHLFSNKFTNQLPTELGQINELTSYFDLHTNSINGSIPSQLGRMVKISQNFSLFSNKITNKLPTQLGKIAELRGSFNLDRNSLNGSIPSEIGKISKLKKKLNLYKNHLHGSLPSELGYLRSLYQELQLSSNRFTNQIPTQLGQITDLTTNFNLDINSFNGSIPSELGRLSKISQSFQLQTNRLTNTLPTQLGMMKLLTSNFSLHENALSGSLPSELGCLKEMSQNFQMQMNKLTSKIPTELGSLSSVNSFFKLSSNHLSGSIPSQFGKLVFLSDQFTIQKNELSSTLPSQLGQLSRHLRQIFMFSNSLQGSLPTEIGSLSAAKQFFVQSNHLNGGLPSQIGNMKQTQEVVLDHNSLHSSLPVSMCNLTGLVIFSAANNDFTGVLPQCIFPRIKIFNVASNLLNGRLPPVHGWDQLSYLLLHENNFHGSLKHLTCNGTTQCPWYDQRETDNEERNEFQQYYDGAYLQDNLKALTLHKNKLDQRLPEGLLLPPTLETFTVSDNRIPGRVPHRLLSLLPNRNSTTILLSNNRLSCDLPSNWMLKADQSSLVLVGNLFSALIPTWVLRQERKATLLSTVVRPEWNKWDLPSWLQILIQFSVVILVALIGLRLIVTTWSSSSLFCWIRPRHPMSPELLFLQRGARLMAWFAAIALACLLPVYALGGNYFMCGDSLMKYSTITYLAETQVLEGVAVGMLGLYTIALSVLLCCLMSLLLRSVPSYTSDPQNMLPEENIDASEEPSKSNTTFLGEPLLEGTGREEEKGEPDEESATLSMEGLSMQERNTKEDDRQNVDGSFRQSLDGSFRQSLDGFFNDVIYASMFRSKSHCQDNTSKKDEDNSEMEPFDFNFHDLSHETMVDTMLRETLHPTENMDAARIDDKLSDGMMSSFDKKLSDDLLWVRPSTDENHNSNISSLNRILAALSAFVWTVILVLLGCGPTVLYLMTYSLPVGSSSQRDVLGIFDETMQSVLRQGLPFYIAFFVKWILPKFSAHIAQRLKSALSYADEQQSKLRAIISTFTRVITIVIVPCLFTLTFNNGCYRRWMRLWKPCKDHTHFSRSISVQFLEYTNFLVDPPAAHYGEINLSLLSHESVCNPSYEHGSCARSILGVFGPVLIKIMIYSVFFSWLEPIVFYFFRCFRRWRHWSEPHFKHPDPMLRLIWLETALIYGGLVPLLLPLLALQFQSDCYIFQWRLSNVSSSHRASSMQGIAMKIQAVLVLSLHSVLSGFFVWDSDIYGKEALILLLAAVFCAFTVSLAVGVPMKGLFRGIC